MQASIQVENLSKSYPSAGGQLQVLKNVSFKVDVGEFVGVVGESGSGKSTLLHILGTLDTPTAGSVFIGGSNPFSGTDMQQSRFRNEHIGFVFQQNNLLPEFNALENVMMPALIGGKPESETRKYARDLLRRVGMDARIDHLPSQLSGGEQQRVAIARALINRPLLILADEPSGNLDSQNAANIHNLFHEMNRALETTILVVTHNVEFAKTLPRCIEFKDGEVQRDVRGD